MKSVMFAAIFGMVVLSGCAAPKPITYDKPGATQADFDQDQRFCKYDVQKSTQTTDPSYRTVIGQEMDRAMRQRDLMRSCMESKGYSASN